MLVYSDPARYYVPPYVGKRGWVGVRLDRKVDWPALERLVQEAYGHVAAKRLTTTRRRA
jgi:predicted DNA-binding protein (MmcQ/YjbR family)